MRRWPTPSARAANGSRSAAQRKHVMSYLSDFLFSPERANSPVRTLSGGERNRAAAGAPVRAAGQRAGARRADQRPRHRHARTARRAAAGLRRHGVPGQPRPALPRQRGHQHHRLGGRGVAGPLARVRRRLRGLEAAARAGAAIAPAAAGNAAAPTPKPAAAASGAAARRAGSASSATRSSANSTSCRRASRRWKPSRRQIGGLLASGELLQRTSPQRVAELRRPLCADRERVDGGAGALGSAGAR